MSEPLREETLTPLETARLSLGPLLEEHAGPLFPGLADPALYPFLPQEPPASVEALRERFRRLQARRSPDGRDAWLNWAARLRDTLTYTGLIEVTLRPDGTALLAYFTFMAFARRGFAAESCAAVIAHLFERWTTTRVVAAIDRRNVPSIRLVERLGFTRFAEVPAADTFKGSVSDEVHYERLREAHR